MYSVAATSAVTALALILVFSSSLAVCCVCMRLAGRRRYKPSDPDEINHVILPSSVKAKQSMVDSQTGQWKIGQLLAKLSMQRKLSYQQQMPGDLIVDFKNQSANYSPIKTNSHDNMVFNSVEIQQHQPAVVGAINLGNGFNTDYYFSPSYHGFLNQGLEHSFYTSTAAYVNSKETEL